MVVRSKINVLSTSIIIDKIIVGVYTYHTSYNHTIIILILGGN